MSIKRHYIAIVPARSGSKGIPHKNIREFAGKPLIYHSIKQGLNAFALKGQVYICTDSKDYESLGISFGAKSLGLRSAASSTDAALDFDVFTEFLFAYKSRIGSYPDALVHLRPTYPIRDENLIDSAIEVFDKNYDDYDSLRSLVKAEETAFKMWLIEQDGKKDVAKSIGLKIIDAIDIHSYSRQSLPICYLQNACIDIIKCSTILEKGSVAGERVYPFLMNQESLDIDTEEDFIAVSKFIKKAGENHG